MPPVVDIEFYGEYLDTPPEKERVRAILDPLLERLEAAGEDYRVLLLSDHKTLTATRGHDGDPVPYLIYDSRVDTHRGGAYDEENGETGPHLACGDCLLSMLFEQGEHK